MGQFTPSSELLMVILLVGAWLVFMCLRVLGTEIDWALRVHKLKVDSHRLKQEQCEQILLRRRLQEEEIEARRAKKRGRVEAGKRASGQAAEKPVKNALSEPVAPSSPESPAPDVEVGEFADAA